MSMASTVRARTTAIVAVTWAGVLLLAGCAAPTKDHTDVSSFSIPGSGVAAACAPLTEESVAASDTAFRGTVTAIEGGEAILRVEDKFRGDVEDFVTVPRQPEGQPSELSIGSLTVGNEFLIAADGSVILTCGQSGAATPELTALYDAAFSR